MNQPDLFAAPMHLDAPATKAYSRELRDEGIKRAKDHADAVADNWHERAFGVFTRYALIQARWPSGAMKEFMTEDVRVFARENRLLPDPPDARAWGAVASRAVRTKLVRRVGYAAQRDPKSHGSPKPLWCVI